MKKIAFATALLAASAAFAGNPARSGSAGASELLINPWARTAGWGEGNTANVRGFEGLYGNVAGTARIDAMQFGFANTQWLMGSGIQLNAGSLVTPTGNGGVLGIHMTSMNYGEIEITTENQPDGGLGTFKPSTTIIGLSYAKKFTQSIFGGVNIKLYSSAINNLSATGVCFDAGVQYVPENIKDFAFGITMRNIGPSFSYRGDGLSVVLPVPTGTYTSSFQSRSEDFELPTQLSIGASKGFTVAKGQKVTLAGNFISNSFKKDQFTLGAEYSYKDLFALRASWAQFDNRFDGANTEAFNGPGAGFTFNIPMGDSKLDLSYAYRMTNSAFGGVHTVGTAIVL
jgi:hypothetical protein